MRPIILLSLATAFPVSAEAAPAAIPEQGEAAPIVHHPDGSFTITEAILPVEEELDAAWDGPERAWPGPGGEPRERSAEEADEALDEAYEEAVALARQEAGPD